MTIPRVQFPLGHKRLKKGDVEGHEFHGNQWTEGEGGKVGTNKKENVRIAIQKVQSYGLKATTESVSRVSKDEAAIYNNSTGEVFINTKSPYWNDPKSNAEKQYSSGWWSSNDPLHPVNHEAGHALYRASDNWNGGKEIAGKVSQYAATNPKEFVAEVHAGKQAGKTYSEDVMRIFNQYASHR